MYNRCDGFEEGFSIDILHQERKALQTYLYDNRWWLLLFNGLLLFIWGPWIANTAPRIDTEVLINTPYTPYNWLDIGRQGGILTECLFGLRWFNPIFSTVGGYLLICVAGTLFGYLLWRAGKKNAVLCSAFGLLCFSAPIMTEQFYFDMQIFKVAWAYVLCGIAVGVSYAATLKRNRFLYAISILCLIWAFSTYQIFVVLYVVMVVSCFILAYQRWTLAEVRTDVAYWKMIGGLVGIFLIAFALNSFITSIFFSSGSEYLAGQIAWLSQTPQQCMRNILSHLKQGFGGASPFFTPLFGVASISVVLLSAIRGWKASNHKLYPLYLLAVVGLQLCPFLLTIFFGTAPTTRAQLAYPMVLACNVAILLDLCACGTIRIIAVLLGILICWTQSDMTTRLIYTEEIRVQEDARLASAIEQEISEIASSNKPISFVGAYQNKLNPSCIRGELIGESIFNWDNSVSPYYLWSSSRACNLSKVLGIPFNNCTEDQMLAARKTALSMPSWPAQGSVVDAGEYIIVKLSEDNWAEELIEPTLKEASFEIPVLEASADEMRVAVDSVSLENEELTVRGWAILHGKDSLSAQTTIYLYDSEQNQFYQMPTVRKQRPDLIPALENGKLYEYGGYLARASTSLLKKPLSSYSIYIGMENNGQLLMMPTGYCFEETK